MNCKRATRLGLSLLLSFTVTTHAFALPNGGPPQEPPSDSGLPADAPLPTDPATGQPLPANAITKLAKYDLAETLFQYHAAYIEARTRMKALYEKVGAEKFNLLLDQNKVTFNIKGYGTVAFTTIDGQPIGRIKHEASGVSFLFLEKSLIEEDSKHLAMYTARQHFDGGADRKKEYYDSTLKLRQLRNGRDNVFVWLSDDEDSSIAKIEQKPRPNFDLNPFRSKGWWSEWFKATYQKPTGYNWLAGLGAGGAQATVAAVVGTTLITTAGLMGVGPAAADMQTQSFAMTIWDSLGSGLVTAIPSFVFGSTLGVFSRTFSNWRKRGSLRTQFWKNTSVSIAFYMGIKAVTNSGLFQFNLLTGSQFVANLVLKNEMKTPNYGFADLEEAARTDQDWLKIKYPTVAKDENGNWKFKMAEQPFLKRVDWNRSFKFYIPMNTLTVIDQVWFTWWMTEFLQGHAPWYMPWLSTAMLASAVPVSWKLLMNFARKKYPDAEKTQRFEEESRNYLDAKTILLNSQDQLKKWGTGIARLSGLNKDQEDKELALDPKIPRQAPAAFDGQAHEGINWFYPVDNLSCEARLTGKKAS